MVGYQLRAESHRVERVEAMMDQETEPYVPLSRGAPGWTGQRAKLCH